MPEAQTLFQTVNADGSVTFSFTGNIHATGLDLDAIPGIHSSVIAQRIQWLRTNDGGLVAQVYAYGDDTVGATAGLISTNTDGSHGVQLAAISGPVGEASQFTRFLVAADGHSVDVMRGDGTSDLLQSPPVPTQPGYVFGTSRKVSTTRPTLVLASIHVGGQSANTGIIQVNIGTFSPAGQGIATLSLSNVNAPVVDITIPVTFIVPPNYFYSIVQAAGAGGSMNSLFEYIL